ncbi:restriction endonuclease [Metabacillus iocasae]|uniref:Restriction endonuclease n=1 Tax=Priestia iocasae TaxID=2291674 RepID=A0ABS2QQ27_9BACI|nr:restriction endonuclease [Metabacillus iocasae]MBM7701563.1 hypothetical protein [Metabacillus iocasae]
MNRGYAGFYKGHYLKSSYEYAYAKYLNYFLIPWSYEDKLFDLGYKTYKPDFFFYNKDHKIIKIVEVKSRNSEAKEKAKKDLEVLKEKYGIECELISYEELYRMYQELPFSLSSTIKEWIDSEETTINKATYGKLNSHYNMKHSEETKRKIGQHTKKLWASNGITKQKMLEGLRKSGLSQKGKLKTPRELRKCKGCNQNFQVLITSTQLFCTRNCSGKEAIKKATKSYMIQRNSVHQEIREYIIQWSIDNKSIVLSTPLNSIKRTLQSMTNNIHQRFGVKDFRVISKAVFGQDLGRKELIRFMKKVCNEKIC